MIMITECLATEITMNNMMKSMRYLGVHKQVAAKRTIL